MADPLTTNIQLAVPIRGTDVGAWDVPVNGDMTLLDSCLGGVQSFALTNAPVSIASSQAQNSIIRLTGTLTANVALTLPSIYKFWTIDNQLVNAPSSFAATLISTGGASIIGLPPGQQDVFYDGTTVNYRNLGRVGEYWDYADIAVPTWVTACTKPPYLNCNGTVFSSATYPVLANMLGTTTLPDARGRYRATLNQTTGRLTTGGGVDGNTAYAAGGNQLLTLGTSQIPVHNHGVNDPTHTHGVSGGVNANPAASFNYASAGFQGAQQQAIVINSAGTGISIQNTGGGGTYQTVSPTYIGGITLIRAA